MGTLLSEADGGHGPHGRTTRPHLLVVADQDVVDQVRLLFAGRGFVVESVPVTTAEPPLTNADIVIIDAPADLRESVLAAIERAPGRRPVSIGVAAGSTPIIDPRFDLSFGRPVDPAHLFAQAVIALGRRRGQGARIPGVVAVVVGNALFEAVKTDLEMALSPINAAAVLEGVLGETSSTPRDVVPADIAAIVLSGRLRAALVEFARADSVAVVLDRIHARLRSMF